jgi:hypothetical protein
MHAPAEKTWDFEGVMKIQLVPLPDGQVSLEMTESDIPFVSSTILKNYPEAISFSDIAEDKIIRFGGCEFVYDNSWDDICIVSTDDRGTRILKQLFG